MNVLVTGGAGYIGSHTAKALANRGHQPIVLDSLEMGHDWAVKWGPLVVGDIGDSELVTRVMRDHKIDAVVHFAAYAYVGESMSAPQKYYENNVSKTLRLLDAILTAGVRRVVFSSSCATYGIPVSVPIDEDSSQFPVNPYGETKLTIERALAWYARAGLLSVVALRYFNAAGADADGEIGETHSPETHLIPLAIRAAARGEPLLVFGGDYPTLDGTAIRDYIHVSDLADAHVRALEHASSFAPFTAINLGTGVGSSVAEVATAVADVSGLALRTEVVDRRAGDPASLVAANGRARQLLGWEPTRSSLRQIVTDAWSWHRIASRRSARE